MSDPGKQLVALCVAFGVIAWFFVFLRCFVRFKIVKSFGLDDWLMILSMVSLVSGIINSGFK